MRAFVAIDVSGAARDHPAHLTIAFLGNVSPDAVPVIEGALARATSGAAAFDLGLGGIGAFPDPVRPRVVWTGVTEGSNHLHALAEAVRRELELVHAEFDAQPFHPHVTLLRVRSPSARARARRLLDGIDAPPAARSVRVVEVLLNESEFIHGRVVHRVVAAFPLRPPPG